jgi:hypothetical protein
MDPYRIVWYSALRLGEFLQALGLVAHEALQLDELWARAGVAFDGNGDTSLILDLPTSIGLLLGGELGKHKVLGAATTPDLGGEWDMLEPG